MHFAPQMKQGASKKTVAKLLMLSWTELIWWALADFQLLVLTFFVIIWVFSTAKVPLGAASIETKMGTLIVLADRARHFNWAKKFILFWLLLLMLSFSGLPFCTVVSPCFSGAVIARLFFFLSFFGSLDLAVSVFDSVRQTSSSSSSQCNWPVSNTNCRAVLLLLLLFLLSAVSELFHWKGRKKLYSFCHMP